MSTPKATLEAILDDMATTIDDDTTAASILVHYSGGNDTWKELFITDDYDVVVEITEGRYGSIRELQDVPVHHQEYFTVSICTIDKFDATPTLIATGSKMQDKMRDQLQSVIEAAAQGSQYTLTTPSGRPDHRRVSGYYMYCFRYDVLYEDSQ